MTRASTIMTWIAVVLFLGAYFFPLWSIDLDAPQYPEGMGMRIWIDKITGKKPYDLQNINGLNHYIGMKEIHAESIPELLIMKYIVASLMLLGTVAALMRKRGLLTAFVVISVVVALAGLRDIDAACALTAGRSDEECITVRNDGLHATGIHANRPDVFPQ